MYLHANAKLGLAGRLALVICCTWTPASTRASCGPDTASPATDRSTRATGCARRQGSGTTTRTRSSTTTPARLRRAPQRRERRDRHRVCRARARLLRRARHRREAADDRQRLQLRQEPLPTRAARPPTASGTSPPAVPAPHQRQGRTLPPDDGTRMGLRPRLPLTSTSATRPCHTGSTTTDVSQVAGRWRPRLRECGWARVTAS